MSRKFRRGQGMTEYIIIVALIAIAAIGVVTIFGDNIRRLFGTSADALAAKNRAKTGAEVSTDAFERKDIGSFGEDHKLK